VDVFKKEKRSWLMSRVKGVDTAPELLIRSLLHRMGYRFRLHVFDLPGKPDIVLPRHRKVIFVNGCFWHGHKRCRRSALPETNRDFWEQKISKTAKRDQRNIRQLRKAGWKVLTIWQCKMTDIEKVDHKILQFMNS
jgi:DNA mismatch endonuclease, patch repair protein